MSAFIYGSAAFHYVIKLILKFKKEFGLIIDTMNFNVCNLLWPFLQIVKLYNVIIYCLIDEHDLLFYITEHLGHTSTHAHTGTHTVNKVHCRGFTHSEHLMAQHEPLFFFFFLDNRLVYSNYTSNQVTITVYIRNTFNERKKAPMNFKTSSKTTTEEYLRETKHTNYCNV